jgi:DNA polymerase-4
VDHRRTMGRVTMSKIKWNNTILHVDINSYFATLLQQENPHLRNKPVGIIKAEKRTCLIATSKEAKKLGIKTGNNAREAVVKVPQLTLLPAQFDRYLDATKRLQKLFQTISPDIYIYSLDEAFINVSHCQKYLYTDIKQLIIHIHQAIKKELGDWVTANIGIAPNYLLAKLASNIAPTGHSLTITPENIDAILAQVPFSEVCGVGFRLEEKLARLGISNPYQIRFFSESDLGNLVGPFWAKELLKIAYGEETHHFDRIEEPPQQMKSVGRSVTGYRLYDNEKEIKAIIYNLISEVIHKARKMHLAGRQVSIYLQGQNQFWGDHLTIKSYINHEQEMFDLLYNQLYLSWQRNFKIIKFGVRLSLLEKVGQDSLLNNWQKREAVHQALDTINDKYGLFTLRSGALLQQPIIKPEVTGFLGDRLYQLSKNT